MYPTKNSTAGNKYLHPTENSIGKVELGMKIASLIYGLLFQNCLRKQRRIWSSGVQGTKCWSCLRILETPLSLPVIDIFASRVNWINFQLDVLESTMTRGRNTYRIIEDSEKNSPQRKRISYFLARNTVRKIS